ncbi:hypothetical protein KCTC32420_01404 [Aequorivita nionensis]
MFEKIINDMSTGLLLWQIVNLLILCVIVYILYKIVKKVSKW